MFTLILNGAKEKQLLQLSLITLRIPKTFIEAYEIENGFMRLFIKTYFVNDKVVISTGVVFAPQSAKRRHIKEFEAIL